ncbi:glycosyltransferase family 4 protein [Paenibacillus cisolokensis]|uniref:glycosyltransferase family 4 protein n=1 Tax=Paenibacillus cisolokensis TaxID=1658519 RepID=UPI003D28BA06
MRQPRRLWILTGEYEPHIIGGLGTVATNLTKAYARNGMHTTVLSQNKHSRITITKTKRVQIIRFPTRAAYYSSKSKQYSPAAIERWLTKRGYHKPDGIHIHSLQFMKLAQHYQAKYRIPVIYTCHSLVAMETGPKTASKKRALNDQKLLLKMANRIVVPSHPELTKLRKLYPFYGNKTVVINHGIVLRKSGARAPRHHLLFVGRIVPLKGIKQLLQAIALLKREGKKVKLDIVGTGPKGYTRHLKSLVKKLGISSEVRWIGHCNQKQLQKRYASRGAVVMPSLQESFGLVALEALASGIPLVSTQAGGLAEFVNSQVAQTIPKVEGPAIAKAIRKMWNYKHTTDQRVAAGRKLASRFQWPHAAEQYQKLFQQF